MHTCLERKIVKIDIDAGLPEDDELEITTLGPGSKNGESIVLHLENDEWCIIDSCWVQKVPIALVYLDSIGVELEKVKMVICTHWHKDHIQGLDYILKYCPNAEFYMTSVGNPDEYMGKILEMAEIEAYDNTIWKCFSNCMDRLADNERIPNSVTHDQPIYLKKGSCVFMNAFGPSDEMVRKFESLLVKINPEKPEINKIKELEDNLCSIALCVDFYGTAIILGGDMETGRVEKYDHTVCNDDCGVHSFCGWCDVIAKSKVFPIKKPYRYIKLPHHSSVTGYCPKLWKESFVEGGPTATTTLFNCGQGEKLPTKDMLTLYHEKCETLYMTSDDKKSIMPKKNPSIKEIPNKEGIEYIPIAEEGVGVIVSRLKAGSNEWNHKIYGRALKVSDAFIESYHK